MENGNSNKKYAIFIVGERGSGKSTLIRSLTGYGKRLWRVKSLSNRDIWAFIIHQSPQELSMRKYPPEDFPNAFERQFRVNRDEYDLLISALELRVRNPAFGYQQYVQSVENQGFDVRLAIIETKWNGEVADQNDITMIQHFARQNNIPFVLLNASNDPNEEASRIRQNLYP